MSAHLIVNPYLQFQPFADADSAFILSAPKPGEGLMDFTVSQSEHPNIFEVFSDLSRTRFDFLDADKDLNADERGLLLENGVLVSEETKPEKPLFACNLEDVEEYSGEIGARRFVVNPGFRFEPFNLANFASLSQKANLSPFRSTVWISAPVTGIRHGYWLSPEDSEIVSKLAAGESPNTEIPETLLRKLISAGIIGTNDAFDKAAAHWEEVVADAHGKFASDKYAVVSGLFSPEQMSAMRSYYRRYVDQGFMPFGDSQVERRYRQHNEPFASFLHGQFSELMSAITGEQVKLSYVYAASYKEGAVLKPHTDREQCEFSISFQVDYEPEPPDHLSPWAIYVEPIPESTVLEESGLYFEPEQLEKERKAPPKTLHLASGDGLIYKGRELIHYRDALPAGHRSTSLFFHFVARDFQGNLN